MFELSEVKEIKIWIAISKNIMLRPQFVLCYYRWIYSLAVTKDDKVNGHLREGKTGRYAKTVFCFLRAIQMNTMAEKGVKYPRNPWLRSWRFVNTLYNFEVIKKQLDSSANNYWKFQREYVLRNRCFFTLLTFLFAAFQLMGPFIASRR